MEEKALLGQPVGDEIRLRVGQLNQPGCEPGGGERGRLTWVLGSYGRSTGMLESSVDVEAFLVCFGFGLGLGPPLLTQVFEERCFFCTQRKRYQTPKQPASTQTINTAARAPPCRPRDGE